MKVVVCEAVAWRACLHSSAVYSSYRGVAAPRVHGGRFAAIALISRHILDIALHDTPNLPYTVSGMTWLLMGARIAIETSAMPTRVHSCLISSTDLLVIVDANNMANAASEAYVSRRSPTAAANRHSDLDTPPRVAGSAPGEMAGRCRTARMLRMTDAMVGGEPVSCFLAATIELSRRAARTLARVRDVDANRLITDFSMRPSPMDRVSHFFMDRDRRRDAYFLVLGAHSGVQHCLKSKHFGSTPRSSMPVTTQNVPSGVVTSGHLPAAHGPCVLPTLRMS